MQSPTMDHLRSPIPSSNGPAPYGRACGTCSQAKVKCITREVGGRCERCHRLNRECRPSVTVRRRHPRKPAVSKTARIERKLDGLLSLLRTGAPSAATDMTAVISDLSLQRHTGTNDTTQREGGVSVDSSDFSGSLSNMTGMTSDTSPRQFPESPFPCEFEPTPSEAEAYLTVFRTEKVKYFPFIHLTEKTNARQLCQERPFLYLCVMAVCSKTRVQQRALGLKIRERIAQHMLHEPADNHLDLLLGLLAYLGWYSHLVLKRPKLSVLTQLAKALVFELGLNKPPTNENNGMPCDSAQHDPKPSTHPRERTMEERRAVLACFLITSIISSFLRKIDTLRWTPHLDECLRVLDETPESLNDEILVQQVRLQRVVENMTQSDWQEVTLDSIGRVRAPPAFYLHAQQYQLQEVKNRPRHHLPGNEVLLAHLHATSLTIHEIALDHMPIISDFPRLDCLYASLDAIKSWFEVFFSIPPTAYVHLPFSIVSQLTHCLLVGYRLSTLEDPAWDTARARTNVDVLLVLDQVIENMAQVIDQETNGDILSGIANALRTMRVRWEARLGSELVISNADQALFNGLSMDFLDNDDWLNIPLSWNS